VRKNPKLKDYLVKGKRHPAHPFLFFPASRVEPPVPPADAASGSEMR